MMRKNGGGNPTSVSTGNREAGDSIGTALMQSIAKIGTQSTMKSILKDVARILAHISQIPSKGNINSSTKKYCSMRT
jgi:hypothetical protein